MIRDVVILLGNNNTMIEEENRSLTGRIQPTKIFLLARKRQLSVSMVIYYTILSVNASILLMLLFGDKAELYQHIPVVASDFINTILILFARYYWDKYSKSITFMIAIGVVKLFIPLILIFIIARTNFWYIIDLATVYYISIPIAIKQLHRYSKIYKYITFTGAINPLIVTSICMFGLAIGALYHMTSDILLVMSFPFYIAMVIGARVNRNIEYFGGIILISLFTVITDKYDIITPINAIRAVVTNYLVLYVVIDDIVCHDIVRRATENNNDDFTIIAQDLYERITPVDDIKIDPPTQIGEMKENE